MSGVSRRHVTVGTIALLASDACGTRTAASLKDLEGGVELTLRRGSTVSAVTVKPPHVIGRDATLRLEKGTLKGSVAGRRFDVDIEDDLISGQVAVRPLSGERVRPQVDTPPPSGAIEADVFGDETGVEASGTWAGGRVHIKFEPSGVFGSIVTLNDGGRCEYRLDRNLGQGVYQGSSQFLSSFEETVLVIPQKLFSWLRWSEIIALLLTVMATPPLTLNDERAADERARSGGRPRQ